MIDDLKIRCELCDNTGWRKVRGADGVVRMARCDHGLGSRQLSVVSGQQTDSRKLMADGFFSLAELMARSPAVKAVLTQTDKRVAELIEQHQGAANPIMIGEIVGALWPGTSMDIKQAGRLVREVKASVERLRTFAHMPVAASKARPYGYYLPTTPQECEETHDRLFREGIKLIRLSQLFRRDANLVRELEGQLQLKSSVVSGQLSVAEKMEAR